MNASILFMMASALIVFALGFVHFIYTVQGTKLRPRDPLLIESMKTGTMFITKETTVWKAWIGFNVSHSMAAVMYGLVFGYLAIFQPDLLYGTLFFQLLGLGTLTGFAILAWLYWFRIPLVGVSLSLLCYVASIALTFS